MKYKVGDRVKIKTWEELEKEFGVDSEGVDINTPPFARVWYSRQMETILNDKFSDRILVIKAIKDDYYYIMEGMSSNWVWEDYMIKELSEKMYMTLEPIETRFELMDFEL